MPDNDAPTTPSIEIYYAYASEDAHWVQELDKHLTFLKRQGLITTWHARLIQAGQDWQHVTDTHLENASVILLLISSDFLTLDYCYGVEMQRALQRQQEHGVRMQAFATGLVAARCVREAGNCEDEALLAAARGLRCTTLYGPFELNIITGYQVGHRVVVVQRQDGERRVVWPPDQAERSVRKLRE